MSLKQQITDNMKNAMRSGDKPRLATIRLILSAVKQIEVDERLGDLPDDRILTCLDKMMKQRRESIHQFEKAERNDLADQEKFELSVIQEFLPTQLEDSEVADMIIAAINETGASSIKDMGKIMSILKPKMQGRADMSKVSNLIRVQLGE